MGARVKREIEIRNRNEFFIEADVGYCLLKRSEIEGLDEGVEMMMR
jgi:hypothetical protein